MDRKTPARKLRLDALLVERGLCADAEEAKRVIWAGKVIVDGDLVDQPATRVRQQAEVRLRGGRYATRGGDKLEEAIAGFGIAIAGRCALDVGAAGGGFTDCLLSHGASRVYAVDVGRGQLAQRLRLDPRVVDLGGRDAMDLAAHDLDPPPALAVVDVTFRSLSDALPRVWGLLTGEREIVALVKPLHEARLAGLADSDDLAGRVLSGLMQRLLDPGLPLWDVMPCAPSGPGAAREFFLHIKPPGRGEAEIRRRTEAAILRAESLPDARARPKRSGRKRRRTWRRIGPREA